MKNLIKSKENNMYNYKKITLLQENQNKYNKLLTKINLKKLNLSKYKNDLEIIRNEVFINQLLDLYNLKKLNELI